MSAADNHISTYMAKQGKTFAKSGELVMLQHTTISVKCQDGRISRERYPNYLKKTKLKRSAASGKVIKQSREAKRKEIEDHDRWTERIESLRNLAAGVAHDFNNLLQGIQGQAELALLIRENGEKLDRSMREIIKAVQRGAEITKHLLAFSGISEAVFNLIDLSICHRITFTFHAECGCIA